jgi:hypothetical protein
MRNNKMMKDNQNGCGRKYSWPILQYYPTINLEILRNNTRKLKTGWLVYHPKFKQEALE